MACGCGCNGMPGGCADGGYYGAGLGSLGSRVLSDAEVLDLLTSDSVINQAVQNAIETGYWPNGAPTTQGWAVTDPKYGTLLIAENAGNGLLTYNADLPGYLNPDAINAPQYRPPDGVPPGPTVCPGWSNIASVNDFLACLIKGLGTVEVLAFLTIGYLIYREVRR